MSNPDAGGAYVRGEDGALKRVERTLGPNEEPEQDAPAEPTTRRGKSPAPAEPETN